RWGVRLPGRLARRSSASRLRPANRSALTRAPWEAGYENSLMATGPLTESAPDCEGDSAVADGRPEGFGESFLMVLIPAGHMEGRLGRGPSETRTRGPEG